MAALKTEERTATKKKDKVDKQEVETLTNMLFLRKNTDKVSPYQKITKNMSKNVRNFCEAHLVGTIDEGPSSATVSWRIMGMRMKRSEGVSTDYDVHRMPSDAEVEDVRIRERVPMERREGVLRLCRYDSENDFKIFKHEYLILKMLAKTYTTRCHCIHFPAILGQGSLAELRYLNVGESTGKHKDIIETPKIPRPYFIMESLEPSVETLFKSNKNIFLPVNTSVYVTIGCVKALRLLHMKGFAHRNVQPAYFALRLPCGGLLNRKECELSDLIAITEFCTCRRYRVNLTKGPNSLAYIGNWKYGSIETLSGKEPTAVDDLISCIYMLTEFVLGYVPWSKAKEKQAIIDWKKQVERWDRVEDDESRVLLNNYSRIFEWLRKQPSLYTIDYEALYEQLLRSPEPGSAADQSLFGFSNPLNDVYEHGFAEKKGSKVGKARKLSTKEKLERSRADSETAKGTFKTEGRNTGSGEKPGGKKASRSKEKSRERSHRRSIGKKSEEKSKRGTKSAEKSKRLTKSGERSKRGPRSKRKDDSLSFHGSKSLQRSKRREVS